MKYSFKEHEKNFIEWCRQGYNLPLSEAQKNKVKDFFKNIDDPNFVPPLYRHQAEAVKRIIYSYEVLQKKDLLVEVVTGGGKSVIIGGIIAYFMIVHDINKFLILVPNTIVRARLKDEFDPESKTFVYNAFQFFYNGTTDLTKRISLHMMEAGKDPTGIRQASIILGNIHQIYEGKISLEIIQKNLGNIVIFNDEAHNSKAENYNEVLNKLKPQRIFRLDTTATPDRLDGLHPDSEKILEYGIKRAMQDRIIKRIIVCKPDIEKVKLTYKDTETGKEIKAEEVPWEEIEHRKIKPTRFITSEKPMRQQIAIAKQCLDYQKKTVALDDIGKPKWKPLLFVVAISITDANNIAKVLENEFKMKTLLVTNESEDSEKEEAMTINRHLKDCEYDAIVSVLMLREGWDVKNISVILLFRKFCYKLNDYTGEKYSVYGQQVIGRGLRRIDPQNKDEWEQCLVIDHPILKHDWLWEMLDADQYQGALNPDELIDVKKIPEPKEFGIETVDQKPEDVKNIMGNIQDIIDGIPNPPKEELKVIQKWEEYLDNYQYQTERIDIEQTIKEIKKRKLATGFNEQEAFDEFKIDVQQVNKFTEFDIEQLKTMITSELGFICRDSLKEYDRNPDKRQDLIFKVLIGHIKKRFLLGNDLFTIEDKNVLKKLWFAMTEIREVFLDPALVESILKNPPEL
jgi:superfamily II DNA or RNA helicase